MSSRSQRVLEAIRRHFRDTGGSPCYREIAFRVGMQPQHVGGVLTKLQRAGALTYAAGRSRSIALVDRAAMLSDAELEMACHARGWQVRRSIMPALVMATPLPPPGEDVTDYGLHLLAELNDVP